MPSWRCPSYLADEGRLIHLAAVLRYAMAPNEMSNACFQGAVHDMSRAPLETEASMARFASLIAAAALAGSAAVPVAAQYQQPYPQPYEQPAPQPGYPYQDQNYGTQGTIGAIIDQLIGNRYNISDRQAIRQCAFAAVRRAQSGYPGYSQAYPAYNNYLRVTAITDVQRR